MDDGLSTLSKAYTYAKKTQTILKQNIILAITTVMVLLVGLVYGFVHMGIGMLMHELSILLVTFNALRLLYRKEEY